MKRNLMAEFNAINNLINELYNEQRYLIEYLEEYGIGNKINENFINKKKAQLETVNHFIRIYESK